MSAQTGEHERVLVSGYRLFRPVHRATFNIWKGRYVGFERHFTRCDDRHSSEVPPGKNLLAGSKEGMKISTAEFLEGPLRPPRLVEFALFHIDIYMWRCDIINHDGIESSRVSDFHLPGRVGAV